MPAVLPDNAAFRQHHAAAELVVQALDKGDRQPAFIDNPHPYGVARAFARAPRAARWSSIFSASGCSAAGASRLWISTSRWRGSVICASRRPKASLVASTIRWTVIASSASAIASLSVMPRIASETSPWVGGARFHSSPCRCASLSGWGRRARCCRRSLRVTGSPYFAIPRASCSASGPR
ncbi:Uncharacterised protein [Klebsiella michiganensis]|nr:Uncharacterised protein [Klebsiella michiganensis]